jgi:hypothetical protein
MPRKEQQFCLAADDIAPATECKPPPAGNLTAKMALERYRRSATPSDFLDYPQVHSGPGDVINTGDVSDGPGLRTQLR